MKKFVDQQWVWMCKEDLMKNLSVTRADTNVRVAKSHGERKRSL